MAIFAPGKLSGAIDALDDSTPGHVGQGGRSGVGCVGYVEWGLRGEVIIVSVSKSITPFENPLISEPQDPDPPYQLHCLKVRIRDAKKE